MIGILDYGVGNVRSILNVYNSLNIKAEIIHNPNQLIICSHIILPGVGSFDKAMSLLESKGFKNKLYEQVILKKKPILGICVGMQILASKSEEGVKEGLNFIEGKIVKLNTNKPMPHMGWNSIKIKKKSKILEDIKDIDKFYFLHSYYYKKSVDRDFIIATSEYEHEITSIIGLNNVIGIQFHPEKSHKQGTIILENFYKKF